jgi:hypothetical protein
MLGALPPNLPANNICQLVGLLLVAMDLLRQGLSAQEQHDSQSLISKSVELAPSPL